MPRLHGSTLRTAPSRCTVWCKAVLRALTLMLLAMLAAGQAQAQAAALPAMAWSCGPLALPAAAMQAAPDGRLTLPQNGTPCWLRLSELRPGLALSFDARRARIALYDGNGRLIGQADRYGNNQQAFLTLDRILFVPPAGSGVLLARLAVDPHHGYPVQVRIEQLPLSSTLEQAGWGWNLQVATLASLLVIALVALLFAFALRSSNTILFALYALALAAIAAHRLYLPQTLSGSPHAAWIWFCLMYPLANSLGLLVMVRLGRLERHSPLTARILVAASAASLVLAPLWYGAAGMADLLNSAMHVLFFPLLYIALWRGWRRGDLDCLLILVSNVPIALFWLPGFIADLSGIELMSPQSGTLAWLNLVSDLLLPLMFLGLLAQRTLAIRERAAYFELNDPVTGLPNRADLQRLDPASMSSARDLVVMVPNVKRFRAINEALGTRVGDQLLAEIAQRLAQVGALHVSRLHADQFCVVTTEPRWPQVRQRLEAQFGAPIEIDGQWIDLHVAVGAARESEQPASGAGDPRMALVQLVRNAEIALDVARTHCLDWVEYDQQLETGRQSDLGLLSELRRAIDDGQFRLFLQPKVRLHDGAMLGAEALLRWQHPTRGLVTPEHFIPFAEKTGCIRMITHWVLGQAMALSTELRAAGQPLQIAVNLSALDLGDPALPALLTALLRQHRANPADLRLEMTEHSAMGDPGVTLAVMQGLRLAGFSLSIDDFGTGYSSLAYLQRLPVSELKIDRAFIHRVRPDQPGFILLQSIVELGHRLGLSVVAEGVESREEWDMLRTLSCDFVQGFYVSMPLAVPQFLQWRTGNAVFEAAPLPAQAAA